MIQILSVLDDLAPGESPFTPDQLALVERARRDGTLGPLLRNEGDIREALLGLLDREEIRRRFEEDHDRLVGLVRGLGPRFDSGPARLWRAGTDGVVELDSVQTSLAEKLGVLWDGGSNGRVVSVNRVTQASQIAVTREMAREMLEAVSQKLGKPIDEITVIVAGPEYNIFEADVWLELGTRVVIKEHGGKARVLLRIKEREPERYKNLLIEEPKGPTKVGDIVVWIAPYPGMIERGIYDYSIDTENGDIPYSSLIVVQTEWGKSVDESFRGRLTLPTDLYGILMARHDVDFDSGRFFLPSEYHVGGSLFVLTPRAGPRSMGRTMEPGDDANSQVRIDPQISASITKGLFWDGYDALGEEDKIRIRERFEGTFRRDESGGRDERYLVYPLVRDEDMDVLVEASRELVREKEYRGARIYSLGRSPQWFITAASLIDRQPDRFSFISFSGGWYRALGCLRRLSQGVPTRAQIVTYRSYLESLGLNPHSIIRREEPTVIVETPSTGGGLYSFAEVLIQWAEELGIKEGLKGRLIFHLLLSDGPEYSDYRNGWNPVLKTLREDGFKVELQTVPGDLAEILGSPLLLFDDRLVPRFELSKTEPGRFPPPISYRESTGLVRFRIMDYLSQVRQRSRARDRDAVTVALQRRAQIIRRVKEWLSPTLHRIERRLPRGDGGCITKSQDVFQILNEEFEIPVGIFEAGLFATRHQYNTYRIPGTDIELIIDFAYGQFLRDELRDSVDDFFIGTREELVAFFDEHRADARPLYDFPKGDAVFDAERFVDFHYGRHWVRDPEATEKRLNDVTLADLQAFWDFQDNAICRLEVGERVAALERVSLGFLTPAKLDVETGDVSKEMIEFWCGREGTGGAQVVSYLWERYAESRRRTGQIKDQQVLLSAMESRWERLYWEARREAYLKIQGVSSHLQTLGIHLPAKKVVTFYHAGLRPQGGLYSASLSEALLYGRGKDRFDVWAVDIPFDQLETIMGGYLCDGGEWTSKSIGISPDIHPEVYGLRRVATFSNGVVTFGDPLDADVTLYGNLRRLGDEYREAAQHTRDCGELPQENQREIKIPKGTRWDVSDRLDKVQITKLDELGFEAFTSAYAIVNGVEIERIGEGGERRGTEDVGRGIRDTARGTMDKGGGGVVVTTPAETGDPEATKASVEGQSLGVDHPVAADSVVMGGVEVFRFDGNTAVMTAKAREWRVESGESRVERLSTHALPLSTVAPLQAVRGGLTWYEQQRRAIVLKQFGEEALDRVVELYRSHGLTVDELAEEGRQLLAQDGDLAARLGVGSIDIDQLSLVQLGVGIWNRIPETGRPPMDKFLSLSRRGRARGCHAAQVLKRHLLTRQQAAMRSARRLMKIY